MKENKTSLQKNLRSYHFAIQGIRYLIRFENNFRFQLAGAVLAIIFGSVFQISVVEWIVFIILIGLVLMAEAFNTALEKLADKVEPNQNQEIGLVKDLAAGAVLIISITACTVGVTILLRAI